MGSHTERGIIVEIGREEKKSDKLKIQTLVIRTNDEYPQYIVFEAANAKCDLLKSLFVNEVVTVHFDMKGKPWSKPDGGTKYFQSNSLWKIDVESAAGDPQEDEKTLKELGFGEPPAQQQRIPQAPNNGRIDDLPF